jgi:hypothetical protein
VGGQKQLILPEKRGRIFKIKPYMNRLLLYVILIASFFSSQAQRKNVARQVDPSQIPAAVKTSQESNFPGIAVTRWEVRDITVSKKFISKYIALFTADNKIIHARYKGDGTLVSSSAYLEAEHIPGFIKKLESSYSGYELKRVEEIKTYAKGKVYYRAHFQKGRKKLIVYTDDNGKELSEEKIPADAKEDEETENE